jgi:DNA-binding winged helix-turn-helix (wHTH) protein
MSTPHSIFFPPFRLDLLNEQLWRDTQEIPLRQKTFAVLRYLLEHAGQLVTKDVLLDTVWAGTTVSDVAPGVCVQELRRALDDDRQTPRFIVTVHRRGYRFIGKVVNSQHSGVSNPLPPSAPSPQPPALTLVGRETELAQLHKWLDTALNGERQLVFISGEPGIGKTTLVETLMFGVRSQGEEQHSARSTEQGAIRGPSFLTPSSGLPAPCFTHGNASNTTAKVSRIYPC